MASELTWLTALLKDFEIHIPSSMIFCDNQAVIHLSSNPTFHEHSKHIEIDCHFIRKKVSTGLIKLVHVNTQHQLADVLTKALKPPFFHYLMSKLGTLDIYLPTWGGYIKYSVVRLLVSWHLDLLHMYIYLQLTQWEVNHSFSLSIIEGPNKKFLVSVWFGVYKRLFII